jgi:hypothetical protein
MTTSIPSCVANVAPPESKKQKLGTPFTVMLVSSNPAIVASPSVRRPLALEAPLVCP